MTSASRALYTRTAASLLDRKEELARAITDALYEAHPDLGPRYGATGRVKCLQDTHHTLEHLAPAVALGDPALFVQYVHWLVDLLRPRGIPLDHVRGSIAAMIAVLGTRLDPAEYAVASVSLDAALGALHAAEIA